ncbi:hypothetical protein EJB05_30175, partial [Eragrostis curvula]
TLKHARKEAFAAMTTNIIATLWILTISSQVLAGATAAVAQPAASPAPAPPPAPAAQAPAIFVFGDGTLDVGNNNELTGGEMGDAPHANHLYYGIDFPPGNNPTGRFSNGYNLADFIAMAVGFGMSPPAYASFPNPGPTKMEGFTGVNYASAEAGIRMSTNADMTIPLSAQVVNFNGTVAQLKVLLGGRKPLNQFLSKSFFLIGVGTMDLLPESNPFDPPTDDKTKVQRLMDMYAATLTSLHGMGARKFGVINVGLIGCVPSVQGSSGHGGGCDESMNRLAAEFNAALGPLLSGLAAKLPRFRYSLADFYGFSNATFANPSAAGFSNIISACCEGPCMPNSYFRAPCSNRKDYWFWDDGYMTEQAAKVTAAAFYSGKAFITPVNFKRLIAMKG